LDFTTAEWRGLEQFSRLLADIQRKRKNRQVGIITANYDISSDWAILNAAFPKKEKDLGNWALNEITSVDFGTEWLDPSEGGHMRCVRPDNPRFFCYKLHGSTNWLRCPTCQQIYINQTGGTWFQAFREIRDGPNTCFCSETKLESQIVSPSFVRKMEDLNLLNIWSHSYDALCRSQHWVIMGYSFPEEDITIRSMFVRALHCRRKSLKVTVVQNSDASKSKYETMFGNHELLFISGGIQGFVDACA
jgi:hypothetical protein